MGKYMVHITLANEHLGLSARVKHGFCYFDTLIYFDNTWVRDYKVSCSMQYSIMSSILLVS